MREILFKNLTMVSSRKKDISLKEIFENNGVLSKTERRCFYFIKDIAPLGEGTDFQKWVDLQNKTSPVTKRHFFIFKEHNEKLGLDKLVCKIAGTFYAIINNTIYTIAFLHSFKANFVKSQLA